MSKGGLIEEFGFVSQYVGETLRYENGNELFIAFGSKNGNLEQVRIKSLPRDHLKKQGTEFYYPGEIWDGKGSGLNKTYTPDQAIELMYDLGSVSSFTKVYDEFSVVSNSN